MVPDVVGMAQEDAERRLSGANLITKVELEKSNVESKGKVLKQSIDHGTLVAEKSTITITVGAGPEGDITEDTKEPSVDNKKPTTNSTITKEVTVMLPSDKDRMTVRVTANGSVAYEGVHSGTEGAISVPVTGSGDVVVVAYIDDKKIIEKTVSF